VGGAGRALLGYTTPKFLRRLESVSLTFLARNLQSS